MSVSQRFLTLEEFLRLPETKPASEYDQGRVTRKLMPLGRHSRVQTMLAAWLVPRLGPAVGVFVELRCTFGGRSLVPDLSVVLPERIPRDADGRLANAFRLAPDLTVEIRSPGQTIEELLEKLDFCVRHGTRLGLLVDPEGGTIEVVRPDRPVETLREGTVDLKALAPGLELPVAEVFGWLR